MIDTQTSRSADINVLEIRNYLLKPDQVTTFQDYFDTHFVAPMEELGGYTLGQYKITGISNRFVWLRGFNDMARRSKFLNDFYINSPVWKQHGGGANAMMVNSDNVYLLRPLTGRMNTRDLNSEKPYTVIDFYICNGTLDRAIDLIETRLIPVRKALNIEDISVWVSEMSENDFPRLPAFQDKNLLVTITNYEDQGEYRKHDQLPADLTELMDEIITVRHHLVLENMRTD